MSESTIGANDLETRKVRAREWFESLRDRIIVTLETLEREAPAALYPGEPGGFERTPWSRPLAADDADQGAVAHHGHALDPMALQQE